MAESQNHKWPFVANGATVNDYAGEFVATACDGKMARLLAAAPVLFLHYGAVRNAVNSLPPEDRRHFDLATGASRRAVEDALKGLKP